MSKRVNEIEIHYVLNKKTGMVDDFKFKDKPPKKIKGVTIMLVECIFNKAQDFGVEYLSDGETGKSQYFDYDIGIEYKVYGLMFCSYRVNYLVCNKYGDPNWIPANLFKIKDSRIPSNWATCVTYLSEEFKPLYDYFQILAIISYSELITSISHYEGILERETDDLIKFFIEKEKMDKEFDEDDEFY